MRPTKIAMKKLDEGMDETAFVSWFHEIYMVSNEKAFPGMGDCRKGEAAARAAGL